MYTLDRWYVAAWSTEVGTTPLARTFFDEPVVLFRGADGRPVALEDRCCHRNLPLSHGRVTEGGQLACGYHGLVFDAAGRCVKIPGQDVVPPAARVRSFPLVERDGAVWIWPGDAAQADAALVPDYPFHGDPRWAHKTCHYLIGGHHELINDNLIDLSHVGYVHGKTIGGTAQAHSEAEMRIDREPGGVTVRRWMRDSMPPPTYQRALGFAGRIDRWMQIRFVPGLIRIYIGANDAGAGLDEAGQMDRLGIRIFNAITPETAGTTHYLWSAAHNFRVGEPEVTEAFFQEIATTFEEDRVVVEAQQQRWERFPDRPTVALKLDAAGLHARRIIAEAIEREAGHRRAA